MPAQEELNLQQQLAVCRQVARLVRAKLPLTARLSEATDTDLDSAPDASAVGAKEGAEAQVNGSSGVAAKISDPTKVVEARIAGGQSLAQAIAGDDSRQSRILSACIEAGERSGSLDRTLESWSSMHIANSNSSKAMRVAMLYPSMLIATAVIALAFVAWLIIPEYRATYELFDQRLPGWLETLVWIREHHWLLIVVILLVSVIPLVTWFIRRQQIDPSGLPRDPTRRARLHALATEVAAIMLEGLVPLNKVVSLTVQAGGGTQQAVEQAFSRLQQQQPVPPLNPETTILLAALHSGLLESDKVATQLHHVADHLRSRADIQARQQARWIPMLVALTVGLATILTYVFLIYLPWIWLLQRTVQPTSTPEL